MLVLNPATGTNSSYIYFNNSGSGGLNVGRSDSAGAGSGLTLTAYDSFVATTGTTGISFNTNNTRAMYIDSGQNVQIGTTTVANSATDVLTVGKNSTSNDASLVIRQFGNGTAAGLQLIAANDTGAAYNQIASSTSGGTQHWRLGGVGGFTGGLAIATSGSDRARFTSGGNFWLGTTVGNAYFGSLFVVAKNGGDVVGFVNTSGVAGETVQTIKGGVNGTDTTTTYLVCQRSDGVERGNIKATGATSVIYNTSSDYRLKTVVGPVTDSGSRLDALEPIEFIWNEDGSTDRGFLAHKFKEIYSHSVSGEKDEVDKNGKPKYQSMQASTAEVIADLVSEIQSLRKRLSAAGIA
jgi:hypothetical protein